MSDGIAYLCITCSGIKLFRNIEKLFVQKDISLIDPGSGFVKMLDENYDIRDYRRDDLLEELSENDQVSFQWWWGEYEDLYCRIRSVDQLSIIELDIQHTTKEQTEKILCSFLEIFHSDRDIVVGFVIDRSGYLNANNYNIDELFVNQTSGIHDMGNELGIAMKEEMTSSCDAQQIAKIMDVIEDSVIVGAKYESRETVTIFE